MRFAGKVTLAAVIILFVFLLGLCVAQPKSGDDDYDPLRRFMMVVGIVQDYYVRDVNRAELIDKALQGMLQKLDPHSSYMDAEEFEDMQSNTSGEFSGIGIEISQQNAMLIVVSPIEDTPADKAGLKTGDIILEIDGESTQDISIFDAVKKIRGKKGTAVELTIIHKGAQTPERVTIVRDNIPIVSVKSTVLEKGYLLLRITRFNERTTKELDEALTKYSKSKQEIKGVVLDLRNNPGGLLDQAVSVSDIFLRKGMIVYIEGKDPKLRKDFTATASSKDIDAPMVVLINAGSASSSEIVAGAMQDHNRALLLGEKTFGKGSVQTVVPFADGGGVKVTTALYYTPNGRSIQADGIEPDIIYPYETASEQNKTSVFNMPREQDLSGHLDKPGATESNKTNKKDTKKADDDKPSEDALAILDKDNQIRLALQLVKQLPKIRDIK